ncbi:MAG: acyl-ACP--UDP-N-acetylglucosamine O-acyltransferase [Sedimentisphaerales bacterium]|nr:acyl-ACP--UDP-N-acetylglucosamine O-acyltransferase [Sedimentisphaerales bacterium]
MSLISPQAAVDPSARIGRDVCIDPFCVLGPDVSIGDGCCLMNNVTIQGHTEVGVGNVFYSNCVIGVAPQDLKYHGEVTRTIIGEHNVFRENVTVHRGTENGGGQTLIGDGNLFMVGVHIAHDCIIGDQVIIGNQTQLAGHVIIEDFAVISALCGAHHFTTIGRYAYVGGLTPVRRDVPPFTKFDSEGVRAVNEEGLKRNGFNDDDIGEIKKAFRRLYRKDGDITDHLRELRETIPMNEHVVYLCNFVEASCQGRFGRFRELQRHDHRSERARRLPHEVRGDGVEEKQP